MKVVGWRAWYDDGSVYDSRIIDWLDLPDDGVQIVMLYFDENASNGKPYREALQAYDWYFRADGPSEPIFGGNNDSPDDTKRRYVNTVFKRGRWIDPESHRKTVEKAFATEDF